MAGIDPISIALEVGSKIIDKIWPNAADAAAAKLELLKMQQSGELAKLTAETSLTEAQIKVNEVSASSSSLFVAGGRPFIIWVCGTAMGYVSILDPLMRFAATVGFGYNGSFPEIDTTITLQVLLGLLGLGGMRTAEKMKGVA